VAEDIVYRLKADVSREALNALYGASWPAHEEQDLSPVLERSLTHVCAYHSELLVGFVYLAWDGGQHAFLLDPTVHPAYRHKGIGTELVRQATTAAREAGCEWLHVDYEAELAPFYERCGFTSTSAGVIELGGARQTRLQRRLDARR
jgi:ribosomal protein S18 acetylase RimI-like enzyme